MTGFDPCSPGYRSAGAGQWTDAQIAGRVSILVLLDTALPVHLHGNPLRRQEVSILVLLDTALPVPVPHDLRGRNTGFDPCSPGYRSAGRAASSCLRPSGVSFRSLFSWIPLCRGVIGMDLDVHICVSILVLLDTALPVAGFGGATYCTSGFDPCSPGYRSAGWNAVGEFDIFNVFRSLFSWIPLCRSNGRALVLQDLRGFDPCSPGYRSAGAVGAGGGGAPPSGFDPCSPGYRSAGRPGKRRRAAKVVSILVLLDTALPAAGRPGPDNWDTRVSILVLLDTALPGQLSHFRPPD